VVSHELWHSQLGHPLSHLLSMFSSELGVESSCRANKVDVCSVCLRAHQTKNQFSISGSIANDSFELIHCDIWVLIKFPPFVVHTISLQLLMMLVELFGYT